MAVAQTHGGSLGEADSTGKTRQRIFGPAQTRATSIKTKGFLGETHPIKRYSADTQRVGYFFPGFGAGASPSPSIKSAASFRRIRANNQSNQ